MKTPPSSSLSPIPSSVQSRVVATASCICLVFFSGLACLDAAVRYVTPTGSDTADGLSWATAKKTLGSAIQTASAGDEIWVAEGTYPERIVMKAEVALYGGFAGNETFRDQRDWTLHKSILDGGQGGIVVRCEAPFATPATRIDGFVIRNGKGVLGGGIACTGCRPTIANNTISDNLSAGPGGGICCYNGADAVIVNNLVTGNKTSGDDADGGGIAAMGGDNPGTTGSSPLILGNVIMANLAEENGGGIAVRDSGSAPVIRNNLILANLSTQPPLGDRSIGGGGIACVEGGMPELVANNTIIGNGGLQAGGILLVGGAEDNPLVVNNTIVGNNGPGVCSIGCNNVRLTNNLIAYNTTGITRSPEVPTGTITPTHNLVFGNAIAYDGLPDATGLAGNLAVDPRLVAWAYGDTHLLPASPCIDSGDTGMADPEWTDMDGRTRVHNGQVDIGADEFDGTVFGANQRIVRVSPDGNDDADGSTWATAMRSIGAAIQVIADTPAPSPHAASGGEVWVAAGTYAEHIGLPPFVHLYGGFHGNETAREQRDPEAHETILDGTDTGRVVLAFGGYRASTIDGFTITGGRIASSISDQGGGIECYQSGPWVARCKIHDNIANLGGGIGIYGGSPSIRDCSIHDNQAAVDGGGWGGAIHMDHSLAWIEDNEMQANTASEGGGIYGTASKPRIRHNNIHDNAGHGIKLINSTSLSWAPLDFMLLADNAIYNHLTSDQGAGIHILYCGGWILDNLVVNNRAGTISGGGTGGGMALLGGRAADGPLTVANNSILGNTADYFGINNGGGISAAVFETPNLIIANNIVAYNSSGIINQNGSPASPLLAKNDFFSNNGMDYQLTGSYGTPAGPLSHPPDIAADPMFVSLSGDFHLQSGSPCIDAADPGYASESDFEGRPRPLDGDNDGTSLADLGAYEYSHPSARGTLEFTVDLIHTHSHAGTVEFEVRRIDGIAGAVGVAYSTTDGTARAGTHYQTAHGTLAFADGQSTATGTVTLLPSAGTGDPLEFQIHLSAPTGGAALGAQTTATVAISRPGPPPNNPWGIPDSWVQDHGLTLSADSDADHDGFPDRFEYFAGTDPRDPASRLQLGVEPLPPEGAMPLSWQSIPGKRYTIRSGTNLDADDPFPTILKSGIIADSTRTTFTVPRGGERIRFYRIDVE